MTIVAHYEPPHEDHEDEPEDYLPVDDEEPEPDKEAD